MTLRDLIESGIEIEGYRKVQCWETEDYPTIYHEGHDFYDMDKKYMEREIRFIFPYNPTPYEAGICIELVEKEG